MKVKATQKFLVSSPRKLRIVAELVRSMEPAEAFERLPYLKKRAAGPLRKVIGTAIANAKQIGVDEKDLKFAEIQINEGPRLKRWRAGARGRAKPYKRRMSHIRVVLTTMEQKNQGTEEPKNKKTATLNALKSSLGPLKKGGSTKAQKAHKNLKT